MFTIDKGVYLDNNKIVRKLGGNIMNFIETIRIYGGNRKHATTKHRGKTIKQIDYGYSVYQALEHSKDCRTTHDFNPQLEVLFSCIK